MDTCTFSTTLANIRSKYGVDHVSQSKCVKQQIIERHPRTIRCDDLMDKPLSIHLHHDKHFPLRYIASMYEVSPAFISERFRDLGIEVKNFYASTPQLLLEQWLSQNDIVFERNNRTVISPQELDIFIPSANLAIEINGIYWHSEAQGKTRSYHLQKTTLCAKQNVQLLHFWDTEILSKFEIVTSMISHRLKLKQQRIHARQCTIESISYAEANAFENQFHLSGGVKGEFHIALKHGTTIVAVASYGSSRFERNTIELLRFCTRANHHVVGALSKLIAYIRKQSNGACITSYCDRRIGAGSGYIAAGFKLAGVTPPNYHYLSPRMDVFSRHKFQKHKLKHMLEFVDMNLSEWENMKLNGYTRIWDCGNYKYVI